MAKHLILAQSGPTADALQAFLGLAKAQYRYAAESESDRKPEQILWEDPRVDLDTYRVMADAIEEKAKGWDDIIEVRAMTVLVDKVDLKRLNPLSVNGWESIVAMLILTFPEIRWVFGVIQAATGTDAEALAKAHGLLSLFGSEADPLFDGTGLREWVRSQARKPHPGRAGQSADYLPQRTEIAVAIDDERSYAYFHAYAAYRFGFRAYAVTQESSMTELLGESGRLKGSGNLRLSVEDLFLNLPDRSTDTHWSDLEQRFEKLRVLNGAGILRVFVTSGQKKGTDDNRRERNRAFRENLRQEGRIGKMLFKPMSGIFDFWKAAGLARKLHGGRQRGQADGFIWPPKYSGGTEDASYHDHSAPGRLLEIAARLEARAERLLQNVHCTLRAIQGAVLSSDAMELLGEKAQTTFLEALALKHQFEAIAECQFYGVQSHFDVQSRMEEVQLEVHELGRYFNRKKRKEAEWNAEAAILNCLIRTYQEYNQFDEEQALQARSRVLHRRLWFKKRMWAIGDELRWLNPFYWATCYLHGLLRSFPVFLLALVLWVVGLSLLFTATNEDNRQVTFSMGMQDAVSSFFSVGTPTHVEDERILPWPPMGTNFAGISSMDRLEARLSLVESNVVAIHSKVHSRKFAPAYVGVVCLAIVAGFIHVGVFISHLYSIVSRK